MYQITTALRKLSKLNKRIRGIQGGTCFVKGTLVLLSNGLYKPIEEVVTGDYVLSLSINRGIIKSRVYNHWSNSATKPIISFVVNGELIRATYDHKFYTTEGYKELYKIVWGNLDTSQRIQLKLLCQQYGKDINNLTLWGWISGDNEASNNINEGKKQKLLSTENSYGRKKCFSASSGSRVLVREQEKSQTSRPSQWKYDGQSCREFGVGESIRKYAESLQNWFSAKKIWREKPQSKTNGQSSDKNTEGVGYKSQEKQKANSGILWGIGSKYKRHFRAEDFLSFTAEQIQIQKPEETFAISVKNVNYFITNNNINVSNSASKTISIIQLLIDQCQRDKTPQLTSITSESMPHLKRGAIRDFKNIMQVHNYWDNKRWNATDFIYTFETGSPLEFFSLDMPHKVRGPRRKRLFINEANNIPKETFDQLEVRTEDVIWLDWNPVTEFWWHTDIVPNMDVDSVILTYKDNEGLPQSIVDSIESRKHNKSWWQVYGLGLIGEVEGRIYTGWNIIDEIPHEARLERYGLDFGYTNDPTAVIAVYKYNGGWILDEVLYRKGMLNKSIADWMLNQPQALIIADSAEPKSITELNLYGLQVIKAKKGSDKKRFGIATVQQQRISVTKRSTNLIKEYRSYLWATDRDGKSLQEPNDGNDHALDAVLYAIKNLIPDDTIPKKQFSGQSILDQLLEEQY